VEHLHRAWLVQHRGDPRGVHEATVSLDPYCAAQPALAGLVTGWQGLMELLAVRTLRDWGNRVDSRRTRTGDGLGTVQQCAAENGSSGRRIVPVCLGSDSTCSVEPLVGRGGSGGWSRRRGSDAWPLTRHGPPCQRRDYGQPGPRVWPCTAQWPVARNCDKPPARVGAPYAARRPRFADASAASSRPVRASALVDLAVRINAPCAGYRGSKPAGRVGGRFRPPLWGTRPAGHIGHYARSDESH
jgi:hypothetical protein